MAKPDVWEQAACGCQATGVFLDSSRNWVQRCDACQRFEYEEEAWEAARKILRGEWDRRPSACDQCGDTGIWLKMIDTVKWYGTEIVECGYCEELGDIDPYVRMCRIVYGEEE